MMKQTTMAELLIDLCAVAHSGDPFKLVAVVNEIFRRLEQAADLEWTDDSYYSIKGHARQEVRGG